MAWTKLPRGLSNHNGKIRIHCQIRRRRYRETLNLSPANQRDVITAAKYLDEIKSRMRAGLSPKAGDQSDSELTIFRIAADEYLETLDTNSNLKLSTIYDYERDLKSHWVPRFGELPCSEISSRMIANAFREMRVAISTKKNRMVPLKGTFQHMGINPNPCNAVVLKRGIRDKAKKVERYSLAERQSLILQLSGEAQVYFAILFGCGLRPGEALGLRWSDYSGTHISITKQITRRRHVESTKTGSRRKVRVPRWTAKIIDNHHTRELGEWIFLNSIGGPHLDSDSFLADWKNAHAQLGIPYRTPYTCRHTRAAELLSTGEHYAAAAKQLGHSVEMFWRVYSEWIEEYAGEDDAEHFEGHELILRSSRKMTQGTEFESQKVSRKCPSTAGGNVIPFKIK